MKGIGNVRVALAVAVLSAAAGAARAGVEADAEDGLAELERSIQPYMVQAGAPLLAALIEHSRDAAVAQGVRPIPDAIRAALAGYVPAATLDRVRWCVACGGKLTLQGGTFLLDEAPAITLDYVVVWQHLADALGDPSLWAHELEHVMQYRKWGVEGFAARYLRDYEAVEQEAAEYRWQWMKRTHYLERRAFRRAAAAENALK